MSRPADEVRRLTDDELEEFGARHVDLLRDLRPEPGPITQAVIAAVAELAARAEERAGFPDLAEGLREISRPGGRYGEGAGIAFDMLYPVMVSLAEASFERWEQEHGETTAS